MAMTHQNPGNFANNPSRARKAGRKGGSMSPGNFKYNRKRAVEAGRKGGMSK
ncbi:MAG TPA: general stress protein [Candidatus Microsaccharimonas sp.]|nr:general stress protein [Candidatus Microsaccharimonas sp.]